MKLNRTLHATVFISGMLAFPIGALALDARDFADKLSATLSATSALEITFSSAEANGDSIILSGLSIPMVEDQNIEKLLTTPIVFSGVSETGDGGYTAKSASFDDIDYTDDGINVQVNNIILSDIYISADPSANLLDTMLFYRGFDAGPLTVSTEDGEIFKIDRFSATNKSNADKTEFFGGYEVTGIYGDLSKIEEEEARVGLAAVGLSAIKARMDGDYSWTLEDGRMRMNELSVTVENVGRLDFTMDFSGYTMEVFERVYGLQQELVGLDPTSSEYEAKSMQMLMSIAAQLSLNEFSIRFDDDGITSQILDIVAAQQGTKREQMVTGLAIMAPAFLAEFNLPELQAEVGEAVAAYLGDPDNIEVKLAPTSPAPIMAIMAVMQNPAALVELLNVSVEANQ